MIKNNRGVVKPKQPIRPKDFRVGGETNIPYVVNFPSGDCSAYLPVGSLQNRGFETYMCVTETVVNICKTLIKWLILTNIMPQRTTDYLTTRGFWKDNEVHISYSFVATMTGTKALHGNWPTTVWEFVRTGGLVTDTEWPDDFSSYENFYRPVTAQAIVLGKEILKYLTFPYQWIIPGPQADDNQIKNAIALYLKQSPLQACIPICPNYSSGNTILPCGKRNADHSVTIYKIE